MKRTVLLLLSIGSLAVASNTRSDDQKPAGTASGAQAAKDSKATASPEELEAKFKAMLTKATLSGRWAPIKDGALGAEKEDKYTIVSTGKVNGDSWVVNAKLKYGDREFVAPIPVKVKWAGDTAVLSVDNMQMPGGKTSYSARVLFYEHTYAGTWSGGDHGGLLSGVITNEKEEKSETPAK
jgi:hypothetical protein